MLEFVQERSESLALNCKTRMGSPGHKEPLRLVGTFVCLQQVLTFGKPSGLGANAGLVSS